MRKLPFDVSLLSLKFYNFCLKILVDFMNAWLFCALKLHNSPSMSARAFSQNRTIATPCPLPLSIYLQRIFLQRLQNNRPTPMFLSSFSKQNIQFRFRNLHWKFGWLAGFHAVSKRNKSSAMSAPFLKQQCRRPMFQYPIGLMDDWLAALHSQTKTLPSMSAPSLKIA